MSSRSDTHPAPSDLRSAGDPVAGRSLIDRLASRQASVTVLALAAIIALVYVGSRVAGLPGVGFIGTTSNSDAAGRAAMQRLVTAVGPRRLIEPRLAGGFAYAPRPQPPANGDEGATGAVGASPVAAASVDLSDAAHALERRYATEDLLSTVRALAAARLLTGKANEAVNLLQSAIARVTARTSLASLPGEASAQNLAGANAAGSPPASVAADAVSIASAHNDLAAALLTRAAAGDRIAALDAADQAILLQPSLVEAWFNVALAAEAAGLPTRATEAWTRYLEHDPSSAWSGEARAHLQALDAARAVKIYEGDASWRTTLEDELLPAWGRATLAGEAGRPAAAFAQAQQHARRILSINGDPFGMAAIATLERITRGPNASARVRQLAAGFENYGLARRRYQADQSQASMPLFARAADSLETLGHPLAMWARLYLSIDSYNQGQVDVALTRLRALRQAAAKQGFLMLVAQCDWMTGLAYFTQGRQSEALDAYERASKAFTAARDTESVASLESLMASAYEQLGDTPQAWRHRETALTQIANRGPRRRHTVLRGAANAAVSAGYLRAAFDIHAAVIENAQVFGRAGALAEAYIGRASTMAAAGELAQSQADLDTAQEWLRRVNDPLLARRFQAEQAAVTGERLQQQEPARAIEWLRRALADAKWTGAGFQYARLHLSLARALIATGARDEARYELEQGIELVERQSRSVTNHLLRVRAFDRTWDLYSELVSLEAQAGRADAALIVAERGRRQLFWDRGDNATPASLDSLFAPASRTSATTLAAALGSSAAIVYYSLGSPKSYCWVITAETRRFIPLDLSSQTVERLVTSYLGVVAQDDAAAVKREGERLSAAVLAPALREIGNLAGPRLVVVVPDGALYRIPFGALPMTDGRYLIEAAAVTTAPSVRAYLQAQQRASSVTVDRTDSALVVANPWPLSPHESDARPLLEAEREAKDIESMLPHVTVLKGRQATSEAFLRTAPHASVVHFAGHARAMLEQPLLSRLLFAADVEGRSDGLTAEQIGTVAWPHTRLVVLAGCQTAAGRLFRGEGMMGLSHAFLAAGVPTVLATLWDVDDRASRMISNRVYAGVVKGQPPVEALRQAQLALLRDDDVGLRAVRNWAGFVSSGAGR